MVKIRTAELSDCKICTGLSQIQELQTAGGSFIPEDYFKVCVDEDEMFIIAELKGEIIGYILGEPMKGNNAHISLLVVSPKHRRKGVGKKLVDSFIKRCKEKKLTFISLYAPSFNQDTIKFYKKIGLKRG